MGEVAKAFGTPAPTPPEVMIKGRPKTEEAIEARKKVEAETRQAMATRRKTVEILQSLFASVTESRDALSQDSDSLRKQITELEKMYEGLNARFKLHFDRLSEESKHAAHFDGDADMLLNKLEEVQKLQTDAVDELVTFSSDVRDKTQKQTEDRLSTAEKKVQELEEHLTAITWRATAVRFFFFSLVCGFGFLGCSA